MAQPPQTAPLEKSMESLEKAHSSSSFSDTHDNAVDNDISRATTPDLSRIQTTRSTRSQKPTILDRVTSRLTIRSTQQATPLPPPDGGRAAWTQCFLTWLVMATSWGMVNSFGAFQTYYTATLGLEQSTISWIGSIQAFLSFFLSTWSGRALDAGLFRPVVITGAILQVLGMFLTSISSKYWHLMLSQGLLMGIGAGMYFCPSMALLSTYFLKKRGIATGIATTGNAVGGLIFPLVIRQLIDKVGFGWTVRVLAFILLAMLTIVVALSKPRMPPRKAGPIIDVAAARDLPYALFAVGVCTVMCGVYFTVYYIASFARAAIGLSYADSLNLVIILNAVGVPARVLPGFAADRWGALNVFIPLLVINVILLYSWTAVHDISGFYAFTVLFGMAGAAFQSMFPVAITSLSDDLSKTGTRLGMALSVISFAALVGAPIGGALLRTDGGGYLPSQLWAATSMLLGTVLVFTARANKFGMFYKGKC